MAPPLRVVYSSGQGRVCPGCGWPQADCRCSKNMAVGQEAVPEKITVKIRIENRPPGKHVTVVDGLPDNRAFLDTLCRSLKKACGTGGTVGKGSIELQGDQRERMREILAKKGMQVKG